MTNKTNKAILLFILFFFSMLKESAGQKSFLNKLKNIDLSRVFYPDSIISDYNEKLKRQESLGFIGNNYQRFEIHISSMIKSKADSFIYDISGKTRVKNNICEFIGTIKIISAEYNTSLPLMKDIGFPNYKQGLIVSEVKIYENSSQTGSGIVNGKLETDIYFNNKGKIYYNALLFYSDGFSNNQFDGKWTSNKTGKSMKCCWGDYRIPNCGDLDIGAGEFSVSDKYLKHGWETYEYAWHSAPNKKTEIKSRQKEETEWWK